MKRSVAVFLQGVIVLLGFVAFTFLLGEPWLEGRNARATFVQVYFRDPFLAYACLASLFFFGGLYRGFRFLGYVARNETSSPRALRALRAVRSCASVLVAMVLGAEAWIVAVRRGEEDIAGGVMLGFLLLLLSIAVAVGAAYLERRVRRGAARSGAI